MTDEFLTLTELAALAGVGISAASNWRSRHADFPRPHLVSGQEKFAADEVTQWLKNRRIPKNALRGNELPGTTYGDRVLRTHQPETVRVIEPDRSRQLLRAINELRGHLDPGSAVEYLLGLLHVKKDNARLWHSLINWVAGESTVDLLAQIERNWPGPQHHRLPPQFEDLADRSLGSVVTAVSELDLGETSPDPGQLADALLEQVARDMGWFGGQFTPPSVVRCMIESLGQQLSGTIYDPFCGSGELLAAAARHGRARLFGQAASARALRVTWLNTSLHERPAEMRLGSPAPFDDKFDDETFDLVVANPPFNLAHRHSTRRTWPFGEPPHHNSNFAWLQHAVTKLAPRGRAAVLMPTMTVLAHGNKEAAIRRRMIEAGVVDCVVALPKNLFRSTTIATTLWILRGIEHTARAAEVHLVDATAAGRMTSGSQRVLDDQDVEGIVEEVLHRRGKTYRHLTARSVGVGEISANDYVLHPPVYVKQANTSPTAQDLRAKIELLTRRLDKLRSHAGQVRLDPRPVTDTVGRGEWEEVLLKDLCEVLAGPAKLDRDGNETPRTPLVLPRNIQSGYIDHEHLDTVSTATATANRNARYRLAVHDIVCVRTGTLGRYGLIRDTEHGWMVGPGCMRLRPTGEVDSRYLTHYLGSPEAYQWLLDHAGGSVIGHISTSALQQLPVWLPSLSVQREIMNAIDTFDEHLEIHQKISATSRELRNLFLPLLIANSRSVPEQRDS